MSILRSLKPTEVTFWRPRNNAMLHQDKYCNFSDDPHQYLGSCTHIAWDSQTFKKCSQDLKTNPWILIYFEIWMPKNSPAVPGICYPSTYCVSSQLICSLFSSCANICPWWSLQFLFYLSLSALLHIPPLVLILLFLLPIFLCSRELFSLSWTCIKLTVQHIYEIEFDCGTA